MVVCSPEHQDICIITGFKSPQPWLTNNFRPLGMGSVQRILFWEHGFAPFRYECHVVLGQAIGTRSNGRLIADSVYMGRNHEHQRDCSYHHCGNPSQLIQTDVFTARRRMKRYTDRQGR